MHEEKFQQKCSAANCRSCGKKGLQPVLDLGMMPLSDGLLSQSQLNARENFYPLEVAFCESCSLVQILETVKPETLFGEDYPYFSSFSQTLLEHSRKNALGLIESRKLGSESFVVELASNDGYLLRNFVEHKIPVLGIDPAKGPANAANRIGVPTLCEFFTRELATKLRNEGKAADVIIANNVLAHVADTNGFVQGMKILLKDDGVIVIEVPYVRELIDHCEFDTIYHEHLCYFSVTSLDKLFRRHGLFLNDIKMLSIHGGSLRLFVQKVEKPTEFLLKTLAREDDLGISRYEYYRMFSQRVAEIRRQLRQMLGDIHSRGKKLAAYGAAAKGAILLNYIGVGSDMIKFVVDKNVHKQGKFMPGVRIPIQDPAVLTKQMPDYVLVLPWNFKDEILSQQKSYRDNGGKFIIPIPSPIVI